MLLLQLLLRLGWLTWQPRVLLRLLEHPLLLLHAIARKALEQLSLLLHLLLKLVQARLFCRFFGVRLRLRLRLQLLARMCRRVRGRPMHVLGGRRGVRCAAGCFAERATGDGSVAASARARAGRSAV